MSSLTPGLARSLLDLHRTERATAKLSSQLTGGKRVGGPGDDPAVWAEAARARSALSSLEAVHSGINEIARNVQAADAAMATIDHYVDMLKDQLEKAAEAEPGMARDAFTANYNEIRSQIDQLIDSIPDLPAKRLLADPAREPAAGDLMVPMGDDRPNKIIHARQVHTGPEGLNIPELPAGAGEAEISDGMTSIAAAKTTLADRRVALATEASDLPRSEEYLASLSALLSAHTDDIETGDMTEAAAELKSASLQQSVIIESLAAAGEFRAALLQLLE